VHLEKCRLANNDVKLRVISCGVLQVLYDSQIVNKCETSDFRRDVDEICALLRYYAAHTGNSSQIFRDNISAPSSRATPEDGANRLSRNVGKELPI
jgi:hypothetical protein